MSAIVPGSDLLHAPSSGRSASPSRRGRRILHAVRSPAERQPDRAWTGAAVALALALAASVGWLATAGSPARTVRALPARERAGVTARALEDLRDVCRRDDRPREFCLAQAELVLGLPECDAACQALAREVQLREVARR